MADQNLVQNEESSLLPLGSPVEIARSSSGDVEESPGLLSNFEELTKEGMDTSVL